VKDGITPQLWHSDVTWDYYLFFIYYYVKPQKEYVAQRYKLHEVETVPQG